LHLRLAGALNNMGEVCHRRDRDRTSSYEYKRRYQTHGLEGPNDLPLVHKRHAMTTPGEVVDGFWR